MSLLSTGPDGSLDKHETFVNAAGNFIINLTGADSNTVVESQFVSGGTYTIKHTCSGNTYKTFVNDVEILSQSLSANYTLTTLKFGMRGTSNFNGYLYYLNFYSNGKLVFEGVPSLDTETQIAGLYDKSSVSFISASGNVQLQAGPKA